jgi:biopolymer transport protein ExbD
MKTPLQGVEEPDLQIAPLIDMTFLLLIYFICTCSLISPEADLGIRLPGMVVQAVSVDMPDEQIVEIRKTGRVFLNNREFDKAESADLPDLTQTLVRYKMSSEAARNEAMITIWADDETPHQRVIDVMNACATARIKNVSFAAGGGE